MLSALIKAFGQLGDPGVRRIVGLAVGIAIAVLVALAVALWLIVSRLDLVSLGWLDFVIDFASGLGFVVLVWLLFPAAVSAGIGLFLDDIARAIERRHYPDLDEPRGQSFRAEVVGGIRMSLLALALNILVLPLYVLSMFFPPLYFFVFYGLNGYLLGREYFEMVAHRRLDREAVWDLRRRHRGRLFVGGVVITGLLTIPVLNFVAPVVATGFMLHLFQGMALRTPAPGTRSIG